MTVGAEMLLGAMTRVGFGYDWIGRVALSLTWLP